MTLKALFKLVLRERFQNPFYVGAFAKLRGISMSTRSFLRFDLQVPKRAFCMHLRDPFNGSFIHVQVFRDYFVMFWP